MLEEIEELAGRYPDIPIEAVFKEDLLRRGMAWTTEALEIPGWNGKSTLKLRKKSV